MQLLLLSQASKQHFEVTSHVVCVLPWVLISFWTALIDFKHYKQTNKPQQQTAKRWCFQRVGTSPQTAALNKPVLSQLALLNQLKNRLSSLIQNTQCAAALRCERGASGADGNQGALAERS